MSDLSPDCFYATWRAAQDGKIPQDKKLRNITRHLFNRTQHLEDGPIHDKHIAFWAERDLPSAAVMVGMTQENIQLPASVEEPLLQILLRSESANLAELQELDQENLILGNPLLYQLIVAAALQHGNRALVRDMVTAAPPGPRHELLFGCDKGPTAVVDIPAREFAHAQAYGHGALSGQPDNGCEIWATMIKAGWAIPRQYMQTWAASSATMEAGRQLFDTLAEKGVKIELWAVRTALSYKKYELLEVALGNYTPKGPEERYELLCAAAHLNPDGLRFFKLLNQHGVNNFNWIPPQTGVVSMPMYREDKVPSRTPLHIAASEGDPKVVDWLIRRGAKASTDYFGMNALQLAKSMGRNDVVAVFERHPTWGRR